MSDVTDVEGGPVEPFAGAYPSTEVRFGRGRLADLADALEARGASRAVVVCGSSVGANRALMDPVEAGLGDRLAAVFDGTTPAKRFGEAAAAAALLAETGADALVAVGGGSAIDVARAARGLAGTADDVGTVRETARETGSLPAPDDEGPSLVAVPTTFAGADLSSGGSVTLGDGDGDGDGDGGSDAAASAGYADDRLAPEVAVYDPDAFATTPAGALVGSAMNGFDKGLEAVYSRNASPMTDAPALRGLSLLAGGLPDLLATPGDPADGLADGSNPAALERCVAGVVLVQFGRGTGGAGTLNVLHAYGHGLRRTTPIQQGVAHAVVVPHALSHLFEAVDGRRATLADALGVRRDGADAADADPGGAREALAEAVVDRVREIRNALGLPARLREVAGVAAADLSAAAAETSADHILDRGPPGYEPTREDVESVLRAAW